MLYHTLALILTLLVVMSVVLVNLYLSAKYSMEDMDALRSERLTSSTRTCPGCRSEAVVCGEYCESCTNLYDGVEESMNQMLEDPNPLVSED